MLIWLTLICAALAGLFVYFLEAGFLLLVVPWSVFWERNLFVGQTGMIVFLDPETWFADIFSTRSSG